MWATILINASAGTVLSMGRDAVRTALEAALERTGRAAEIRFEEADRLEQHLADAAREGADRPLLVGGGDGTISMAAGLLAGSDVTLGVLPLGTMNLLARALGTPLALENATEALARGTPVTIDLGAVNGRVFVHHVSLGLHAKMIVLRDASGYHSRMHKVWVSARSWARAVRRPPSLWLDADTAEESVHMRTPAVVITNNRLSREFGGLPLPERLDGGVLEVHIAKARGRLDLVALSLATFAGRWDDEKLFASLSAQRCRIEMRRSRVRASVDGEIVSLQGPLEIEIRPGALSVLAPAVATTDAEES